MPTTRPCATRCARIRDNHPAPQPRSKILSVGSICIRPRAGLVIGQCSCSMDSPLPDSAQRLNSSRRFSSVRDFVTQTLVSRSLEMPAACPAEMSAHRLQRATAAEVRRTARRDQHGGDARLRCTGPQQRNTPTDHGPAKQQIHHEYARCVSFAVPDDRRQKVQHDSNKKKRHVRTSSVLRSPEQRLPASISKLRYDSKALQVPWTFRLWLAAG